MECNTSYVEWYEQILNVTNTEVHMIRNVDTYEVQETVSCLENHGLLALRQLSMFRTCKRFATLASFEISVYVSVTQIFIPCHWREILVVGLILGCPWHHTSQNSLPLYFTLFIIFVGSESIFHGSQLRYLSLHS